jgi:hypothetical protein
MMESLRSAAGARRSALVATLVVVACVACGERPGKAGSTPADSATTSVAADTLPPVSWRFESPASWDDRVRVVEDPDGRARLAAQGIRSARLFEYLPRDSTIVPQTLLGIYAYDSTAWARLAAAEGPPPGELLLQERGVAYVAGIAQSNPFAPGSDDFREFARRSVSLAQVRDAFRVVR